MAVGWFMAPYKRRDVGGNPGRYVSVDDFTDQVLADGGYWAESEILGNYALVKVRASAATLSAIAAAPGVQRIPGSLQLSDTLASLTTNQKTAIRNFVTGTLGYTLAEVQARFPNDLGTYTLGDLLRFVTQRRLTPRYDAATDTIVLDGAQVTPTQPEIVDAEV